MKLKIILKLLKQKRSFPLSGGEMIPPKPFCPMSPFRPHNPHSEAEAHRMIRTQLTLLWTESCPSSDAVSVGPAPHVPVSVTAAFPRCLCFRRCCRPGPVCFAHPSPRPTCSAAHPPGLRAPAGPPGGCGASPWSSWLRSGSWWAAESTGAPPARRRGLPHREAALSLRAYPETL